MVIAPAMTIPGTNHFASTPDVIAVPFFSASVNGPRRLELSFSIRFIAHLKYSQMMKEQAGGDSRHEIPNATETCPLMWNLCREFRRP